MVEKFRYENLLKYAKIMGCKYNKGNSHKVQPKLNLYIRLTDICNAKCAFCEYHTRKTTAIDVKKLRDIVAYLQAVDLLGKIQITGGEPTCNRQFVNIVKMLRDTVGEDTFIGVNSNGSNMKKLLAVKNELSNVAISRHSDIDKENERIFKTRVMTTEELRDFINKMGADKVHLSCTLMKDYVGTKERVKRYLDYMQQIGCFDVGFVTLMPCNEYAKSQQVYFEDIKVEEIEEVKKECEWENEKDGVVNCYCANYTYKGIVDFYARFAKLPGDCVGQLVYNCDNKVYTSFGKKIELEW